MIGLDFEKQFSNTESTIKFFNSYPAKIKFWNRMPEEYLPYVANFPKIEDFEIRLTRTLKIV